MYLKLFRVKLVGRWVSGPGSHWQTRLLVVRYMRQDRLEGLAGGSGWGGKNVRSLHGHGGGVDWGPYFLGLDYSFCSVDLSGLCYCQGRASQTLRDSLGFILVWSITSHWILK